MQLWLITTCHSFKPSKLELGHGLASQRLRLQNDIDACKNLQHFGSLCHTWGVWIHGTQSRGVWCCRAGDSRQWGCLLEAEEAQLMPLSTSLSFVYDFMNSNCYRTDWTKKQLRFLKMTLRWPRRMLAEQWPNLNQFWSPATVVHLARSIGDSKPSNMCCFQRDGSSRNCVVICLRLIVIW